MENRMRIRKIPIEMLMDLLDQYWHGGVDYVDIHGEIEGDHETLHVSFNRTYMNEEYADNFDSFQDNDSEEQEQPSSSIKNKLSDEDLNQLI